MNLLKDLKSRLAQRIENEHIPDDVIEWGVYKAGTADTLARFDTHSPLPHIFGFSTFSRACRNHDYRYTR